MDRFDGSNHALIDLRVPANQASRYRVRFTEVTPCSARLELAFVPALFRKGKMTSCPADLTVIVGSLVIQVRGVFRLDEESGSNAARFDYDGPIDQRELELLRWRGPPGDAVPVETPVEVEEPLPVYAS